MHGKTKVIQKRKARNIAAKRRDEVLCIFLCPQFNVEDAEWENENEVEYDLPNPNETETENDLIFPQISSLDEWLKNPFSELD